MLVRLLVHCPSRLQRWVRHPWMRLRIRLRRRAPRYALPGLLMIIFISTILLTSITLSGLRAVRVIQDVLHGLLSTIHDSNSVLLMRMLIKMMLSLAVVGQ